MQVLLKPLGAMDLLSQAEVDRLTANTGSAVFQLFRNCCLAVLNVGRHTDSSVEVLERYQNFSVSLVSRQQGIHILLKNPPPGAFVDGQLIRGIHEHLFSVLRDILFSHGMRVHSSGPARTHQVFDMLRNARVIHPRYKPGMIVCWGGHSINTEEYEYSKEVGYQLGLRGLDVCTGCGPGAMKGPMKGAAIAHSEQRNKDGRYLGLTEPGIIAAEPPNPIVNELVILPNIEMRLEAFVRIAHGIVIFPGGVGTTEELLYLLGILLHPDNREHVLPVVLSGPTSSQPYFDALKEFLMQALGEEAALRFEVIVGDPVLVADRMKQGTQRLRTYRKSAGDSYGFNWSLRIEEGFQNPFLVTHAGMSSLDLGKNQDKAELAANLRRAFSGIVTGNLKEQGIRLVRESGPFVLRGEQSMAIILDRLLSELARQGRMKLPGTRYEPCYRVESGS